MRFNPVQNLKKWISEESLNKLNPQIESDNSAIFFELRKEIIRKLHETETGRLDLKNSIIKKLDNQENFTSFLEILEDNISQYNRCSFFGCYRWSAGKLTETLKKLRDFSRTIFEEVSEKNKTKHLQKLFLESYPQLDRAIDDCIATALANTQARSSIMHYEDVSINVQLSSKSIIEEARCYKDFEERFNNLTNELKCSEYKSISELKGGLELLSLRMKQTKLIYESISQKEITYKPDEKYEFTDTFEEYFSCTSDNERHLQRALFHARLEIHNIAGSFDSYSRKSLFIEAVGKYVVERDDLNDADKKWILAKVILMAECPDKPEDLLRRVKPEIHSAMRFC